MSQSKAKSGGWLASQLRRAPSGFFLIGGVTVINLVIAAVSFVKDLAFAAYFGTSAAGDLVNKAYLLPETIGYNLVASVIAVAAVPAFTRYWSEGRMTDYAAHVRRFALHMTAAMVAVAVILIACGPIVLRLYGVEPGTEGRPELGRLYMLLLVALPLFPLYAVFAAALQSARAFYVAAAGPLVLNGIMLAAVMLALALGLSPQNGSVLYAGAIVAGTLGMGAMAMLRTRTVLQEGRAAASAHIPAQAFADVQSALAVEAGGLPAQGAMSPVAPAAFAPERAAADHAALTRTLTAPDSDRAAPGLAAAGRTGRLEGMRGLYQLFVPFFLLTLAAQVIYALERMLAANLNTGTITALTYAYRVAQFPNWVFVAAVTAVLLPSLSEAAKTPGAARLATIKAIRGTLVLLVPAAILLFAGRRLVVTLLFSRGAFDAYAVGLTSELLAGYSLSVVGQAVSAIGVRYFLAQGRLYGPVLVYVAGAACNAAFDFLLLDRLGASALGYGAAFGWSINALFMVWLILRRRHAPD